MTLPPRQTPPWRSVTAGGGDLSHTADADVVIIGAGIVGMTTATLLAEAGARVVVLEDRHVGAGTTGFTTAKVTALHGTRYQKIAAHRGDDPAARYATANSEALDWIRERCAKDVDLTRWEDAAAFTVAAEDDERQTVDEELAAASHAGLAVEAVADVGLPFARLHGIRLGGQGQFDAGGFLELLARSATDAGAIVVTGARATGVERRDGVLLVPTSAGAVSGSWVVVATGLPFLDRALLFARAEAKMSYAVAGRLDGELPDGMHLSAGSTPWSVRTTPDPDAARPGARLLLVGGGGHKTGHIDSSTEDRYRNLVAFAGRFGTFEPTHRWGAEDFVSPDGLPYVGGSRLLPPEVHVATGFGKWGMTTGVAAAQVIAARIGGAAPRPWAADWAVDRVGLRTVPKLARANGDVAAHLTGGWAGTLKPRRRRPAEGHGVTTIGRHGPVATATRDGETKRVSAVCTHLGGIVAWNDGDGCWDCPLHGSRFDHDGTVLHSPAIRDLAPR